ncbi:DUF4256 domain-containing protein [Raoultibacter timonensis]|uniref:DUF4256 domain-containing protein n=1 Tax=Raoultibacter timonensis TaxID=1907662 RepID=UPI0026DC373F|nr:DUF4256 domain-containing protein [Raoultibacter timonensis]
MKRAAVALSEQQKNDLIELLEARFASHPERHATIAWPEVHARIDGNEEALRSLYLMERTEGEPDVIGMDVVTGKAVFVDCSPESPLGRRNLCYDRAALEGRKKNKPSGNAVDEARAMGIELLDEDRYRRLQALGEFDRKTSSWIETPESIRDLGGALFCDRRYDTVFVYHNGADSYYGARGFRGVLYV